MIIFKVSRIYDVTSRFYIDLWCSWNGQLFIKRSDQIRLKSFGARVGSWSRISLPRTHPCRHLKSWMKSRLFLCLDLQWYLIGKKIRFTSGDAIHEFYDIFLFQYLHFMNLRLSWSLLASRGRSWTSNNGDFSVINLMVANITTRIWLMPYLPIRFGSGYLDKDKA